MLTPNGYRTEVESFQNITMLTPNTYGPTSFKVETKDGMVIEYGATENSRRIIGGITVDWYINKVTDKFGNFYTYTYSNLNGTIRPVSIDYTMNYSNAQNIQ